MDNNLPAVEEKNLGGVKTPEGKEVSKFNALKHGILRNSLTEYEDDFYVNIVEDLTSDFEPQGVIEQMLIERIALCYLKLFRVQKAETEFMKASLKPVDIELDLSFGKNEDGYEPQIKDNHVERLLNVYSRYETTIENRLFRALHELQRVQSARLSNKTLQSLAVDVNQVGSFGETEKLQ